MRPHSHELTPDSRARVAEMMAAHKREMLGGEVREYEQTTCYLLFFLE